MQSYRHHTIRLPDYDYSQPGWYMITLVADQRRKRFGEIVFGEIQENQIGKMVRREWQSIPQRFLSVELDEFVVMPNHLHGIICIQDTVQQNLTSPIQHEAFGHPTQRSIPTIIRSFKAAVTLRARRILGEPQTRIWQRNYYEKVIRNESGLQAARLYIHENPNNWAVDQENDDLKADIDTGTAG